MFEKLLKYTVFFKDEIRGKYNKIYIIFLFLLEPTQ